MISIPDSETMSATLSRPLPPELRNILEEIAAHSMEAGLRDLTFIVVIEPSDAEATIAEEIGFSPCVNPIDGTRYGQAGFEPYWAYLRERGAWYELTHTISNDGFAVILLADGKGDDDLRRMCREYAGMQP